MMQNRISEMQDEEVDYLRFDRIKIQRKRMEHILEVIKDLSFKNKELFKENAALKEERMHQSHYQKLYRELTTERTILIDKNMQLSSELEKYRETVLHQEILINSLKQELYGESLSIYPQNYHDIKQSQLEHIEKQQLMGQQYRILQAQYEDLKKEYSELYRIASSNKNVSAQKVSHNKHYDKIVCGKENENSKYHYSQCKHSENSPSRYLTYDRVPCTYQQESQQVSKLREKYEKCKKVKKELVNEIKILRESLNSYELREKRHVELIQVLKQKRTKICMCHVNKLKKKLSQTMFQMEEVSLSPKRTN